MPKGKIIRKAVTEQEIKVDAFIPFGERFADLVLPDWRSTRGRNMWSRIFLDKMNILTIAAGLRVPFGKEVMAGRECCRKGKIYYSLEHDNFYCRKCNKGMGQEYYMKNIGNKWRPKRWSGEKWRL